MIDSRERVSDAIYDHSRIDGAVWEMAHDEILGDNLKPVAMECHLLQIDVLLVCRQFYYYGACIIYATNVFSFRDFLGLKLF